MRNINIPMLIIACSMLLNGCSDSNDKQEVHRYISSVKAKAQNLDKSTTKKEDKINNNKSKTATKSPKKTPDKKVTKPAKKTAKKDRNPFISGPESASAADGGKLFSKWFKGGAKLIGIMEQNNKKWAIIRSSDGKLFVVTQGKRIGKEL